MKATRRTRYLSEGDSPDETRRRRARDARRFVLAALATFAAGACGSTRPPALLGSQKADALQQTVLGTAQAFAVLAGSAVTNTGPTTVEGDLGVDPGSAVTGFPPGLVTDGTIHRSDVVALQAQTDTTTAYDTLAGLAITEDLSGQDLGGMTLVAGVYHFSSSAQLTGALTLDAKGDPSAVFVFQVASTLTTASGSSVLVVDSAQGCNVFFQVGSSATLGTTTTFKGNIIALASITLDTGATVSGRTLARNGAVTMDSNDVSILSCAASTDAGTDTGGDSSSGADSSPDAGGISEAGADTSSPAEAAADAGEGGSNLCCGGVLCGTSCIDLSGDIANCGSCGNACASSQFCAAGTCVTCGSVCAGACVDLATDDANCGTCGNACPASQACTGGSCAPCASLCAGACVDLSSDPFNCGSCGNACLASAVCTSGACVTCPSLCGGTCADLDDDPLNCGACGQSCPPGESCKSGSCVCQ
jgi:hypothetical protein